MNRAFLTGFVATEPIVRSTQNGSEIARFRLAVRRPYKQENGQYLTDFFTIVAGGRNAERVRNLKKGQRILVQGRLENTQYTSQDGVRHQVSELWLEDLEYLTPPADSNAHVPPPVTTPQRPAAAQMPPPDDYPF